ncbi:hypothetical protein RDWZM_007771 [Blomia tropicalis]|uniref:AB hydrolase-1 domain-containing protein n=1 Tax=Blomia tropicalis TaxID=40697 RepID=A0A9Q0M040_BLOTA|nr:Phospholipase abhd3 [Blomia tropicalis]KAJ6216614.1 hypothetical protein RDWZM_007771 [Blomia tropicalis]
MIETYAFILIALFALFVIYYLATAVRRPQLIASKQNPFRRLIEEQCSIINEYYWPTIWCFQAHLISVISNLIRGLFAPNLNFVREYIDTHDGGRITLDWYVYNQTNPNDDDKTKPIILFIPGIAGNSQAEYLRTLIPIASKIGYRVASLNHRGVDGEPIRTGRMYCGADSTDLEQTIKHIRNSNPDCRLIATGISMGATILTGYLVSSGSKSMVDAAFLISMCWDFMAGKINLTNGPLNRALNQQLAKSLVQVVLNNRKWYENDVYDIEHIAQCDTLGKFDRAFTIKMFGFKTIDDYYRAATYTDRIDHIRTPTVAINASDDMICTGDDLPLKMIEESKYVTMVLTKKGGHIGFIEGLFGSSFFLERFAQQYFTALYRMESTPKKLYEESWNIWNYTKLFY